MEPFGNRETIGMRDGTVFGDDADILCIVTLWGIGLPARIIIIKVPVPSSRRKTVRTNEMYA